MLNPQTDNAMQTVEGAVHDAGEQGARIVKVSTEASERAARAGAEMMQKNAETMHQALQSSAEMAARLAERSADQFSRVFGLSGEEASKAAQKSSENFDAIMHSSSLLVEATQSISREWSNFARGRMEENIKRFEQLLHCRTPQDFAAVQSELWRDNLDSFLQYARRIAETSMQATDAAARRVSEAVEPARAA
ncbi:MAG: phasin family protein [Xanthobacteraceae bacterium]